VYTWSILELFIRLKFSFTFFSRFFLRHLSANSGARIFCRAPLLFGSTSTISRFGERFRDGQYSLVSFLFAVLPLTAPPPPRAQPFVKVRGSVSPSPIESAPMFAKRLLIKSCESTASPGGDDGREGDTAVDDFERH